MLDSVTEILKMVGLKSVEPDVLNFKIYDVNELKKAIRDKKCPVINVTKDNQVEVLS